MARFGVSIPRAPTRVTRPANAPNAAKDRGAVLRAPRLKALSMGTRDYAKAERKAEDPNAIPPAGFGNTGL